MLFIPSLLEVLTYRINTTADFLNITKQVDTHVFILESDLDFTDVPYKIQIFNGTFKGQNHTISNVNITEPIRTSTELTAAVNQSHWAIFGPACGTLTHIFVNLTVVNVTIGYKSYEPLYNEKIFAAGLLSYGEIELYLVDVKNVTISLQGNQNNRVIGGIVAQATNISGLKVSVENFTLNLVHTGDGKQVGIAIGGFAGLANNISCNKCYAWVTAGSNSEFTQVQMGGLVGQLTGPFPSEVVLSMTNVNATFTGRRVIVGGFVGHANENTVRFENVRNTFNFNCVNGEFGGLVAKGFTKVQASYLVTLFVQPVTAVNAFAGTDDLQAQCLQCFAETTAATILTYQRTHDQLNETIWGSSDSDTVPDLVIQDLQPVDEKRPISFYPSFTDPNKTCEQNCDESASCVKDLIGEIVLYTCQCLPDSFVVEEVCIPFGCLDSDGLVCGGDITKCNVASKACIPTVAAHNSTGMIIGIIVGLMLLLALLSTLIILAMKRREEDKKKPKAPKPLTPSKESLTDKTENTEYTGTSKLSSPKEVVPQQEAEEMPMVTHRKVRGKDVVKMPNIHKMEDLGSLIQKSKMPTKPILQLSQLKPQSPQLQSPKAPTPKIQSPDLASESTINKKQAKQAKTRDSPEDPDELENEIFEAKKRVQKVRKSLAPAPLALKRAQELKPLKAVRKVKPVIQLSEEMGMI
ncbi:Conserved_hypothetical protein [Hexamita inflata]|uniref:Uncharacterized protein n=1 Tax=Hexamita inflata TaxID=28002 RepID=A0AA86Q9E0_9EUKA|nr:Conserved hypothetical protein [Hexamita inflata]